MERAENWSMAVEDFIDEGDIEGAISLLESVISRLETLNSSSSDLQLASALSDLANLYLSQGFSLKAEEFRNRAFTIKKSAQQISIGEGDLKSIGKKDSVEAKVSSSCNAIASLEDDWESIADYTPDELFPPQVEAGVSRLSLEDTNFQTPKRRGRGTFLYEKNGLYSDQQLDIDTINDSEDEVACRSPEGNTEIRISRFGTSHVLVLAGFPPSTRTTELEKLVENFKDRGVAIRWINDTVALAVFRTPSIALEARNSICCPFTVRLLDENDSLLHLISTRDLEPPIPRPKTSVRTAQRLIAHGMGQKLPKSNFGSSELRKQEDARRKRIVTRQILRDEAWGPE